MNDTVGTRQELIEEIRALKKRIADLELLEAEGRHAREVLQESVEEYRDIFENAMMGMFRSTPDGKYLRANMALAKIYGYSSPDELMSAITDIAGQLYVDPGDRERCMEYLAEKDMIYGREIEVYRRDGSRMWISMNARVVRGAEGSPVYYEGIVEDITLRRRADDAVRWNAALLEAQLNTVIDGILVVDEDHKDLVHNQRFVDMWNIPRHILDDGDTTARLEHIAAQVMDPDGFVEKVLHLYDHSRETSRDEIEMKNGMVLDRHSAPVLGEDGHHYGRIWTFRDITERKRAEQQLHESQRRLADIIEFLPDATLAIDRAGKVIAWNRAIETMTGVSKEDMLGKGDHEYALPFYGTRRPILINFVTIWDDEMEKQYSFIKKDGDTLYTETDVPFVRGQKRNLWGKAGPLYDIHGNVVGAIESIRDITERKEAVRELFAEKEKMRSLSENAPIGMALIDRTGSFVYINPRFKAIFGYDLTDIPNGRTWFRKAYPDEAYRRRVIKAWLDYLGTGGLRNQGVYSVVCKNGSTRVISFIPVQLGNGDVIMVCEDITERKRLEAQLVNAQKMEAVGTLSGGIAHDFNNILMGIQGYISLMMIDTGQGHPHHEWLRNIEELVRNAADLTRQLLGFARGGKYDVKPFSMNELVEKTSAMFGRTKKEIVIHHGYQADIWPVEADQGQIEQVLLNLYLNAWQAMPAGGVLSLGTRNTVLAAAEAEVHSVAPGRYVCTFITDSGVGMDEKTKERIFEPFFTTKELGRGTGLGLAMVYGIVKNHNGYIDVESEPGKGSTFRFCLPASGKDIARVRLETAEMARGAGTVLLVDDEPAVLTVSKAMIESLGYAVHAVRNGGEAISLYGEKKDSIDLIVLDMIMPGLSGSETFDRIRELNPEARVILSSGYSLNEQARSIMEKGCRGFVQKPFTIADISRKLREILQE